MPKKFTKVNGKLVLENTRRTKVKPEGGIEQAFDAFLEERYGSNPTPFDERETQSVSIDVDATSELEVLHDVISDEAVNALNDTIVEEDVPEEVQELTEETVYEQEEIVESANPIMDRYISAIKDHPSPEAIAEQDLQNSPASLADLKNVETSVRNIQTALTSMGGGGVGPQEVLSLIEEYAPEVVLDSDHLDYLAGKLDSDFKFTDSDEVIAIIHYTVDSAYVQSRVEIPDAILKSGDDSDRTFAMNKGVFLQTNNLSAQDALTLTYDGATALHIEKDGSLKINKTDFLDSNEVPNVGWVLKNSGDSAETIALIQEYRDSSWFTSELQKNDLGELNDVDVPGRAHKDFLMWNGAQWVPHQQFADTGFHYKGDIDATAPNSAPAYNTHGDMWVNKGSGIVDASWVGLAGSAVDSGDMLVYDSNHVPAEWDNFGHLGGGGGISTIFEGYGIDVDNTTPANPVVSVDTVQTDLRYLQRTGGTMEGNVTFTDGNDLIMQNTAEIRTSSVNNTGDLTIKRNGNDRIKITSSATQISGQPLIYNGIADTEITQDGHLITKSYASDNFITNKGGIITHSSSSPDPTHAFRIAFSNTNVPAGSSAVEVDLTKADTIAFRGEANPAGVAATHTGFYAHQNSLGPYTNLQNVLIGYSYEAENGGQNNVVVDASFVGLSKGTLIRSVVNGNEQFSVTHDGNVTANDVTASSIVADDLTTSSGNLKVLGNLQIENPNALVTNNIKSIGNSNLTIIRNNDTKMLFGSDVTLAHQPIRYQTAASDAVGGDEKDLIDIKYAEAHITGKVRTVNNLPGTLERGVIYLTSGNVLTVGL